MRLASTNTATASDAFNSQELDIETARDNFNKSKLKFEHHTSLVQQYVNLLSEANAES